MLGVYHKNPTWYVVLCSLGVMLLAYVIGLILGMVAQRCVDEQVQMHRLANPIPEDDDTIETETA